MAQTVVYKRVAASNLEILQGRWQHSLDDFGLFTVYGDVAVFDRGSGLRIKGAEDGEVYANGWVLSKEFTVQDHIVWTRPSGMESGDRGLLMQLDRRQWKEWHVKTGTCGWKRPDPARLDLADRFYRLPPQGIPGFPERVSMFEVPPPASTPAACRPLRLLVYGGCLTIGWPSGDMYARALVDRLGDMGMFVDVVGCGVSAHTSDILAEGLWKKNFIDKMGMRGEGILQLRKRRGPFDLVLIMAGLPDIVRGSRGEGVLLLHRACHSRGANTVAISVPPSWHDDPSNFSSEDLQRVQTLDSTHGFRDVNAVTSTKRDLNRDLQQLASERKPPTAGKRKHGHCALFVDTADVIPCSSRERLLWEPADFIHLTAAGQQRLGRGVAEQLLPLLQSMSANNSGRRCTALKGSSQVNAKTCNVQAPVSLSSAPEDDHSTAKPLDTPASPPSLEDSLEDLASAGTSWHDGLEGLLSVKPGKDNHAQPVDDVTLVNAAEPASCQQSGGGGVGDEASTGGEMPPHADGGDKALRSHMWRVVGGGMKGGIVVRHGKSLDSAQHAVRLSVGALLREVELSGERLHYRKIYGEGPWSGWVSLSARGRPLLELEEQV